MAPCTVRWCGKNSQTSSFEKDKITFYRYPKDPELKEKWIVATHRENWFPSEFSVICSRHFTQDCFFNMKNRRRLLGSAIPSLLLPVLADSAKTESTLAALDTEAVLSVISISPTSETSDPLKIIVSPDKPSTSSTLQSISEHPISTPKRKKSIPGCDLPPKYNTAKKRLCRRVIELNGKIIQKNRQIKNLKQKIGYLEKKVVTLKFIVKEFEKKFLASAENLD